LFSTNFSFDQFRLKRIKTVPSKTSNVASVVGDIFHTQCYLQTKVKHSRVKNGAKNQATTRTYMNNEINLIEELQLESEGNSKRLEGQKDQKVD